MENCMEENGNPSPFFGMFLGFDSSGKQLWELIDPRNITSNQNIQQPGPEIHYTPGTKELPDNILPIEEF